MRFREPGSVRAERQFSAEYLARDHRPSEALEAKDANRILRVVKAAPGVPRSMRRRPARTDWLDDIHLRRVDLLFSNDEKSRTLMTNHLNPIAPSISLATQLRGKSRNRREGHERMALAPRGAGKAQRHAPSPGAFLCSAERTSTLRQKAA